MENEELIQCDASDAEKLSQLSIQCFMDAYAPFDNEEEVQRFMDQAYAVDQLVKELNNPDSFFYFLKKENTIAGYLKLNIGAAQTEELADEYLEIERIYLRKAFFRQGLGGFMIRFTIELAKSKGKQKIWLGVWEENSRGISFYKAMGFNVFGEHTFMVGNLPEVDLMMEIEVE